MQYIVICLKDKTEDHPATYVQVTRKRFTDQDNALDYTKMIASSRTPVVVLVPDVEVNEKGYPVFQP